MLADKKFIKSIKGYTGHIESGKLFKVGVTLTAEDASRLEQLGFSADLTPGEQVVPTKVGRYTRINHDGEELKRKDLPKQKAYTTLWFTRSQFAGRDERKEVLDFYDHCYMKWQTEHIPAPSLRISLIKNNGQAFIVVDKDFVKDDGENKEAVFATNLILELFHRAEFFTEDMQTFQKPAHPIRIVDWVLIPEGNKIPWEKRMESYGSLLSKVKDTKKTVFLDRFSTILKYKPDAEARGTRGFQGYVVFSFDKLGIHVFESIHSGNATYVVAGNWESVSRLSKSEIIQNSLHEFRLIHHDGWKDNIDKLLSQNIILAS